MNENEANRARDKLAALVDLQSDRGYVFLDALIKKAYISRITIRTVTMAELEIVLGVTATMMGDRGILMSGLPKMTITGEPRSAIIFSGMLDVITFLKKFTGLDAHVYVTRHDMKILFLKQVLVDRDVTRETEQIEMDFATAESARADRT